ncbi:MAG: tetratricopeptide repeat protein, partial [Myxococcota bacterium]
RRVPIGAVVGALSVVVGLAVFGGLTASTQARARACRAGAGRAAEVWTTGTRQAVLDALRATKAPGVEDAWGRSEQLLDAWNGAWSAEWQDACDDTHARAEQSAQLLDARLDCLTARLAESTALATELGKPTAKMVERLAEATSRLTAPSTCSAAALTRDRQRTPPEAQRAAVAAINEKLARVRVLDNLGSPGDAKKLALEAGDDAKRLGWLPAQAETLLFIGATQHRSGETKQAVTSLREAVYVAEEADAPFTAARAWIDLVRVLAIDARLDDASDAARHAQAYQPRVGTPESQTHLAINLGELYLAQRKPELALEQYLVAREHGLAGGNAVEAAGALANLGRTYSQLGRSQEAVDTLHESVRAFEAAQGPEHPNVAIALNNLASASLNLGLLDEARAASERAVAIREKALGPKHVLVARALGNSARVLEARGELDEAQRAYERVKSITTAAMGADHPFNADPLLDLGRLAKDRGDLVTARANVEEALALREKKLGPAHLDVGAALLELAALERAAGRLDVAEKVLARAAPIYEKASGDAAVPLRLEQGELELARGKLSEAARLFTGALEARRAALGERAPTLREPLVALARVALEQGHDAAALTKLDEAAALPGRASAEFQLARARALWKSDRAQAEKALTEARRRWPKLTLDDRGKVP